MTAPRPGSPLPRCGLPSPTATIRVWRRALLTGVVMGAALAVKPLIFPAMLPVGWWLLSRRRYDHLAGAVGAAIVLWFAAALPWGLGNVWGQSVTYNSGAGPRYAKVAQFRKLFSTMGSRDLLVIGALAVSIGALVAAILSSPGAITSREAGTAGRAGRRDGDRALGRSDRRRARAGAGAVPQSPRRAHSAARDPRRDPRPVTPRVVILLVLLIPWSAHNLQSILEPTNYRGCDAAVMRTLHTLPSNAQMISDDNGFIYRAGLRTPRLMNDSSVKRIDQHLLTTASVGRAAADPRVSRVPRVVLGSVAIFPASPPRYAPTAGGRAPVRRRAHPLAPPDLPERDDRVCGPHGVWAETHSLDRYLVRPRASKRRRIGTRSMTALNETNSAATVNRISPISTKLRGPRPTSSTTARPSTAPSTFAPVSPIIRCSRRSSPSNPQNAPITGAIAMPTASPPRDERDRDPRDEPDLDRAPRRPVEQVGEVRGERDEHRVGEQAPARDERDVRCQHERDRGAAEDLERACGDPAPARAPQVAAKAPVALGPEQVVDQSEQSETQAGEQHERPRDVATGLVADAERSERVPAGFDHDHRDHDEQPGRGRQRAVAEVAALQRGRVEQRRGRRSPAAVR